MSEPSITKCSVFGVNQGQHNETKARRIVSRATKAKQSRDGIDDSLW